MRCYDISRELFSAPVYPGDPKSEVKRIASMDEGADYNISSFSACCHSGTHLDAPSHVIVHGKDIASIPLQRCIGNCTVLDCQSVMICEELDRILQESEKILLLKTGGNPVLTPEAAEKIANAGITLLGIDAISLARNSVDELAIHRIVLGKGIPILEGLDFSQVPAGNYLLVAFPLKLSGVEASPVRAVLIDDGLMKNARK